MNGTLAPFERGDLNLPPFDAFAADLERQHGMPREAAQYHYDRLSRDEVWLNDEYQVNIDRNPWHDMPSAVIWHVSIKRRDKGASHDWRDLQAIKNALVGPEFEAIELYPATDRTIDSCNQYHLWVFVELNGERAPKLPFGWRTRFVTSEPGGNAKQRPLDQEGANL